jgi:oligopeptidase B
MSSLKSKAPQAEKIPHPLLTHGDEREDNYYWLRDKEKAETIAYLEEENAYHKDFMQVTEGLQETLFQEIKGRIKEDDQSVPYQKHGYWYYIRYNKGQEHPLYCRKKGSLKGEEEILIDANIEAAKHSFYQIGGLSISPNNQWLAYGVDTVSRRIYTIHFKNLETGEILTREIKETTGSCTWSADSTYVFYTTKDETLRPNKVFRHHFGSKTEGPFEDLEIFHEEDSTFVCSVYKSKSEDFILIGSYSTLSNEFRFIKSDQPESDFSIIQPRKQDLEYMVAHFGEHWYIRTNYQQADNFKLMRCPIYKSLCENWEEVIPHREEIFLEGIELFRNYIVIEERKEGLTKIRVKRWDGSLDYYMDFGSETYTAGCGINPDFDSENLRYSYSSLTSPNSVMEINMATQEKQLLKQQEVVGGYDENLYQSERIWADGHDGTKIPMSLVYRKDCFKKGQPQKTLLYAYGSYGHTIEPNFSSTRLSLLDRGFIFVIAHVRGGQYLGRKWYEDGKMLKKRNTFYDYIACAEHLIKEKYTSPKLLSGLGGSAGGLLIGAVINLKPELFHAMIAAVPFVDVVTTMLDESIPLTTGEYDEWGNPNNEEYYQYMKSYSPYDNVKAQDYPALLITTGLHDSQVQYWEPAKWCAKLRETKTDTNPLLLYTNMETGHGGASGRFEALRETAMEYAFLIHLLNEEA